MRMNIIVCPSCGKDVEIGEAIQHQWEEKFKEKDKEKRKLEIEQARFAAKAQAEKALRIEFQQESKEKQKELESVKKKEKELEERIVKEEKEREKIEAKIKETAKKAAQQESGLEINTLKKQLEDAREAEKKANRASEDLKRKLNQGSQQLQGEVGELWLEEELRKNFPYDELKPVPKGIRGGDVVHVIKNKYGNIAGSILWEAKRQKAWNRAWPAKLKDDMRKISASDCIVVTDILPPNIKVYDRMDNVWVTSYEYVIKLASVLRLGLLNVAIARSSASHGDEKLQELYRVITSNSFRHMFEARLEIIERMRKELEAEKASTERRWKRQGINIESLARNNRELYGELEAHIPSLKPLSDSEFLELESGIEEENDTPKL